MAVDRGIRSLVNRQGVIWVDSMSGPACWRSSVRAVGLGWREPAVRGEDEKGAVSGGAGGTVGEVAASGGPWWRGDMA